MATLKIYFELFLLNRKASFDMKLVRKYQIDLQIINSLNCFNQTSCGSHGGHLENLF